MLKPNQLKYIRYFLKTVESILRLVLLMVRILKDLV
jgi:hypothetical protein